MDGQESVIVRGRTPSDADGADKDDGTVVGSALEHAHLAVVERLVQQTLDGASAWAHEAVGVSVSHRVVGSRGGRRIDARRAPVAV